MKKHIFFILSFLLLFKVPLKAQDILNSFSYNPDPYSSAVGLSGVANVNSGPAGYLYNPALLGYFSKQVNYSYQTFTPVQEWYGVKTISNNFTLGYKFPDIFPGMKINAGAGYRRFKTLVPFLDDNVTHDFYSFGVSLEYFATISFGMNFKNISQHYHNTSLDYHELDWFARDWGLLLNLPVLKLIDDDLIYKPGILEFFPYVNFSLGYCRSNIGEKYTDALGEKKDLPLTERVGYNLSVGSDLKVGDRAIQLFDLTLILDASKEFTGYDDYLKSYFRYGNGNINVFENLLKWKGSDNVDLHKGISLSFFETASLLMGSYQMGVFPGYSTDGYVISSEGIFKLFSFYTSDEYPYVRYALDHLEIKYMKGNFKIEESFFEVDRTFSSLSLSVKNLSF